MGKHNVDKKEKVHYEFGGPVGAFGCIVGLPVVIYALYFVCNEERCVSMQNPLDPAFWTAVRASLPQSLSQLVTGEAAYMYLGWMALHVLLERILPGESVEGAELPNKKKLSYTMSGHLQFWLTIVLMGHAYPLLQAAQQCVSGEESLSLSALLAQVYEVRGFQALPLHLVYDHYLGLITVSVVFSFLFSVYLYVSSFLPSGKILAKGGNTGSAVYDFFIGRELNPRIGSLDLKEFCELRPGLIGWAVLNLGNVKRSTR